MSHAPRCCSRRRSDMGVGPAPTFLCGLLREAGAPALPLPTHFLPEPLPHLPTCKDAVSKFTAISHSYF